jgi:hypothetical protein
LEQAADLFLYVLSHIPLFSFLSSIGSSKTKKKNILRSLISRFCMACKKRSKPFFIAPN